MSDEVPSGVPDPLSHVPTGAVPSVVQAAEAAGFTLTGPSVFAVNVQCPTHLTVSATGIGPQTTADLKLDVLNGAGEVSGLTQVMEWGLIETPIASRSGHS